MTREEAIKWLENLKEDIGPPRHEALWHYEQALDEIIKILTKEPKTGKWIPCSERLPSEERHYLCCNKGYLPFTAHYHDGQWHCFDESPSHVDAWMPLPKSYREESEVEE